jgi:hypothetical protein
VLAQLAAVVLAAALAGLAVRSAEPFDRSVLSSFLATLALLLPAFWICGYEYAETWASCIGLMFLVPAMWLGSHEAEQPSRWNKTTGIRFAGSVICACAAVALAYWYSGMEVMP